MTSGRLKQIYEQKKLREMKFSRQDMLEFGKQLEQCAKEILALKDHLPVQEELQLFIAKKKL